MKLNFDFFVERLSNENKAIRDCAGFAYRVIQDECAKALSQPEIMPKNYFSQRAQKVYAHAKRDAELNAVRICFFALYEYCREYNDALTTPTARLAVKQVKPVISDDSPPFAFIDGLNTMIELELIREKSQAPTVILALLLCRHANIKSVAQLTAVLSADLNDLVVFKDALFASLTTASKRFLLDAVAIQAFKLLKSRPPRELKTTIITAQLKSLWLSYSAEQLLIEKSVTLSSAIQAISFFSQSIAATTFEDAFSQLSDVSFIKAVAGIGAPSSFVANATPKQARHQKRTTKEFVKLEKLTELFECNALRKFAFDARTASSDSELLDSIRKSVQAFANADKRQRRSTAAFKLLKVNLIAALSSAYDTHSDISLTATAVATYLIDLALHGSHFKDKLRMSTIETYLSTLTVFAKSAWCDELLLHNAQESNEQLEALTESVADALSAIGETTKQGTALGFLQYLSQATKLKFFDAQELEYLGAGSVETRAHYINTQDLNEACEAFLAKSNIAERHQFALFIKLSYATGLRRKEATLLEIDDVRFNLETIYVSQLTQRKTMRAVRHIPTCLLSAELELELQTHIDERRRLGYSTVFDEATLTALDDEFLAILRETCNNDELVNHSLRHSAANNLVLLFAMCCVLGLLDYRERLYFLKNDTFSDARISSISQSLKKIGKSANLFFPTLDVAAQILGHVSPAVTARSYLHLLDVLFFMHDAQRAQALSSELAAALVSTSNYRFEFKKQYESYLPDASRCEQLLFKSYTRGLKYVLQCSASNKKNDAIVSQQFSFSDYLNALKLYKQSPGGSIEEAPLTHFEAHAGELDINFLSDKAFTSNNRAWIRLLDSVSNTAWNPKNRRAIQTLRQTIEKDSITNLRIAERHFRALKLLSLTNLTIALHLPRHDARAEKWKALIDKNDFIPSLSEHDVDTCIAIATRPLNLRWPLWRYLPEILNLLDSYITFESNKKEINSL